MSNEGFYARSERLRREWVAAREAEEAAHIERLLAEGWSVGSARDQYDAALWNAKRADPHLRQGYREALDSFLREEARTLWNNPVPGADGIWTHNAVIARRTGKEIDFEEWQCERERSALIEKQTEIVARKLEELTLIHI
mgnify:FL=1